MRESYTNDYMIAAHHKDDPRLFVSVLTSRRAES